LTVVDFDVEMLAAVVKEHFNLVGVVAGWQITKETLGQLYVSYDREVTRSVDCEACLD